LRSDPQLVGAGESPVEIRRGARVVFRGHVLRERHERDVLVEVRYDAVAAA
jgi:hypothetical protein